MDVVRGKSACKQAANVSFAGKTEKNYRLTG
jgi:hypothetical protein